MEMRYQDENIYSDGELAEGATIRNFRIVQTDGTKPVSSETEYEKYRIIQDRIYRSDFGDFLLLQEQAAKYGAEE